MARIFDPLPRFVFPTRAPPCLAGASSHRRSSGAPGRRLRRERHATPHQIRLVHATLADRFVRILPERLIDDNAYGSDRLDAELACRGVELIALHRRTRQQRTQDGRPLRR